MYYELYVQMSYAMKRTDRDQINLSGTRINEMTKSLIHSACAAGVTPCLLCSRRNKTEVLQIPGRGPILRLKLNSPWRVSFALGNLAYHISLASDEVLD